MQPYKNLSGQSDITAYEIGEDFINIKFKNISKNGFNTYKYTYLSASPNHIEQMKQLATTGSGLNSYINKNKKTLHFSSKYYTA